MSMPKIKIQIVFITMFILLSACSSSQRQNEFSKHIAYPFETKTRATDYLSCFGDMLTSYRSKKGNKLDLLRVAIISVKDATDVSTVTYANSEIPSDFKDMTLSLISKIGGPVRVIHIPTSAELLDAARYRGLAAAGKVFTPFLDAFSATHYRGDTVQLYGALTEYDRILTSNQRELDGSLEFGSGRGETNLEATTSGILNVARMTMDFRAVNAKIGDVVNNTSSSNTVKVYQRGTDRSFGISIDGNAIGYSTSRSVVDARHKAIRLLIEWGIIETLGRYAQVPYWKCLPNSNNTRLVGFKDMLPSSHLYNFQQLNRSKPKAVVYKESSLQDVRDKSLLNAVISSFHNAEYLKSQNRRLLRRPEKDTSLISKKVIAVLDPNAKGKEKGKKTINKVVKTKSLIRGKSTLRTKVLSLYKKDPKYSKLSESQLISRLHNEFVKNKILHPKDSKYGAHMYIALWLNAPVQRNARWRKR